jgi:hypothetical protein
MEAVSYQYGAASILSFTRNLKMMHPVLPPCFVMPLNNVASGKAGRAAATRGMRIPPHPRSA